MTAPAFLRRLLALLLIAGPVVLGAQPARIAIGRTIAGVVYDSLSRTPLRGATVQLVTVPGTPLRAMAATTDTAGRFALHDVANGTYDIGFLHPILDSIGIEPVVRRIDVAAEVQPLQLTLTTPGPMRLHEAICGRRARGDSSGIVVGHVRDAAGGDGIAGARVTIEWRSLVLQTMQVVAPKAETSTSNSGWFAFCGVPPGEVGLVAIRENDTTALVPLDVGRQGFGRRDLFLGRAVIETSLRRNPAGGDDTLRLRRGFSRFTGRVRDATNGRPIAGAQVTQMGSGVVTTTNDSGAFVLSQVPGGTRAVVVRALGFLPDQAIIDFVDGATTEAYQFQLTATRGLLDTMRINVRALAARDIKGFANRRRTAFGQFLDTNDVRRLNPVQTSDLLRRASKVQLVNTDSGGGRRLMLRDCEPRIVIDGFVMHNMDEDDLNSWVVPENIAGIEVYATAATVPPDFAINGFEDCGAIVIWTRLNPRKTSPRKTDRR